MPIQIILDPDLGGVAIVTQTQKNVLNFESKQFESLLNEGHCLLVTVASYRILNDDEVDLFNE